MSKYGDDIRRIARYKRTEEGDPKNPQKSEINGTRGVAIENGGNITSFRSTPGTQTASTRAAEIIASLLEGEVTDELKEALQKALGLDTDSTELEDAPEAFGAPGSVGSATAEEIIDGTGQLSKDPNFQLNRITDIADGGTGQDVELRFDATIDPPNARPGTQALGDDNDGAVYDNSLDEGTYVGFQQGFSWQDGGQEEAVPAITAAKYTASTRAGLFPNSYWDPSSLRVTAVSGGVETQYSYEWYEFPGATATTRNIIRASCSLGVDPFCPLTAPTSEQYPSWWLSVLTYGEDGLVKSSVFDTTDVGIVYREGKSIQWFTFDNGNRNMIIEPGIDNTSLIYEVNSSGSVISDVKVWTRGKIEYTPGREGQVVSKPRVLKETVAAADINSYRVGDPTQRIVRLQSVIPGRIFRK